MSLQNYKEERALIARSTHATITRRAYLIGVIDTKSNPPKFLGCDIFSEPSPTLGARYSFVIAEAKGASYEDAVKNLRKMINEWREYDWCKKTLVERKGCATEVKALDREIEKDEGP